MTSYNQHDEFVVRQGVVLSLLLSGAVLTGGASRRMGRDKALLTHRGETLLTRTLHILHTVCDDVLIVGDRPAYHGLGVCVHADLWPGCGPLGGVATALRNAKHPFVLCLACDMPLVSGTLLRAMADHSRDYDALVPRTSDADGRQQVHSLHAIYAKHLLPQLERQIAHGTLQMTQVLATMNVVFLDEDWLRTVDSALDSLSNVNTPEDAAQFRLTHQ